MASLVASVLMGTQEVSSLASALQGLLGLVSNVATAAPQVWAGVSQEFDHAKAAFHLTNIAQSSRVPMRTDATAAVAAQQPTAADAGQQDDSAGGHVQAIEPNASASSVPNEVQAQVERSGQLPGMPEPAPGSEPVPPAIANASQIAELEAQIAALKGQGLPQS